MNVKLACTCCRPLVDLELLSCHHHGLRFLEKTTSLQLTNGCRWMPSWLVPAVGQLSPPRFVSWKTTKKKLQMLQINGKLACTWCTLLVHLGRQGCYDQILFPLWTEQPLKLKMDADGRNIGLYPRQALSILRTAKLLPPKFVFAWKTTNPSTKKNAANEWQTGLYLLHTLSRLGTAELSPPQFLSGKRHTFNSKWLQMHVKVACACCRPLVDLELLRCHHHGLFLGGQQTFN